MNQAQLDKFIEKAARHVVSEVLDSIKETDAAIDEVDQLQLKMSVLSKLTGAFLFEALVVTPEAEVTDQQAYEFAWKNYTQRKALVEEAVATGFEVAMSAFSGRQNDYACTVHAVNADAKGCM